MADLTMLSKFISLVLRHEPVKYGLVLDADGFADFEALWGVIEHNYNGPVTRDDLLRVIEGDRHGKKRFELNQDRVRALFGHSAGSPAMVYRAVEPPALLFHGTVRRFLTFIQMDGLKPQSRQYVHLTTNREEAGRVGRRHGRDFVLLTIRANEAHRSGVAFYQADAERFLAKHVPPGFIDEA